MAEESYEGASEEVQRIYKSLESAADVTRQETSSVYGTSNLKLYSVAIPINPLLPKTKENLNSGALIQARLGRIAPQGPPPFGNIYQYKLTVLTLLMIIVNFLALGMTEDYK